VIWREKRNLLLFLGVLLLANTMFFFTYRVQYQSRLDDLDARLTAAEKSLDDARVARLTTERKLQGYRKVETDVAAVFDEHWSTQSKRFTAMIAEVKRLALASSLKPSAYSFDRGEVKGAELRRGENIGATEVGMGFTVQGTYQQARRMINLLELSRQFVIIDKIALASATDDTLTLTLHLKTLFRDETPRRGNTTNRL
jgi:Tfp pilus assembly protein PilO